jgi:hypothetical protein
MKKFLLSLILLASIALASAQPTFYRYSTFDQLVAVTPHGTDTAAVAFVYGDASRDDGFGGLFLWNGVSTSATNAFSVFRPVTIAAVDEGRWIRLAGQYWNQATVATAANEYTYAGPQLFQGSTHVFGIGADASFVYLQSWGSSGLKLNSQGNTLTIGPSGAAFKSILSATATLDFPSIPANATTNLTITVTGASTNDSVSLGPPLAWTSEIGLTSFVSANDTVTVRAINPTAAAINPASGTFRATVIHY